MGAKIGKKHLLAIFRNPKGNFFDALMNRKALVKNFVTFYVFLFLVLLRRIKVGESK